MKVISTDNLDRETVADKLIVENVTIEQGKAIVDELNKYGPRYEKWYEVVKDDYELSRGMEDLV